MARAGSRASESSSLADVDYYTYSHSSSSSLSAESAFPLPPTAASNPPSATPGHSSNRASLTHIDVPSFSKFRSQVSSIPLPSPTAGRKAVSFQAPLHSASRSLGDHASPPLADPGTRPHSLQSPVQTQSRVGISSPLAEEHNPTPLEQLSFSFPFNSHDRNDSIDSRDSDNHAASSQYIDSRRSSIPIHTRYAQDNTLSHVPKLSASSIDLTSHYSPAPRLSTTSSMNGVQHPPTMKLELDGVRRTLTDESMSPVDSDTRRPKSPGGRLGNFFGWKSNTKSSPESPSTAFSNGSQSPRLSPFYGKSSPHDMTPTGPRLSPPVQAPNAQQRSDYFSNDDTPMLLGSAETNAHVKELEKELTQVSTELAESIRREMDLEDEVDRLKADMPSMPASEMARRGSDYFSDADTSSSRLPILDPESKFDMLEQKLRKVEQEKAQIKVEMASRLQTELSRRRDLEEMVQKLETQLGSKNEEEDERGDMEERVEELESTLEDTRRLLNQERQAKGSFEDLYTATREELERHKNEHDNLRDEVVPQLKARIDGLESEVGDSQALVYENSRMQQELAALRSKMHGRFGSIAEEGDVAAAMHRPGLSRSGSGGVARSQSARRGGSVSRSGSVLDRSDGPRQRSGSGTYTMSADAVKDIEDQRDALHKALKLLIVRSEKQQKEHEYAIKKLTSAKNMAEAAIPGRSAYHKEVSFLKEEVATLRKRTEDALEQKWQYEKGLSGIKMDLDRAELETRGLRIILQEHDILGSSQRTLLADGQESGEGAADQLQQSITTAESERDQARKIAEEYRQRAQEVQDGSSTELMNSAKRMDELAEQLEKQVQSNKELRTRLAEAVAKGEREQRESNGKIGEMQKRLASMEDSVLAAQQHSETTLGNHEAEVRRLEEASSPALQRLRISVQSSKRLTPTSPMLMRSPKLGSKKLSENSLLEMSKTQMLERKVKELEGLLREAEEDMQDVVQRVTHSQLEVAELQTERDSALKQMRRLQTQVVEEREKAEQLMR